VKEKASRENAIEHSFFSFSFLNNTRVFFCFHQSYFFIFYHKKMSEEHEASNIVKVASRKPAIVYVHACEREFEQSETVIVSGLGGGMFF
jgi:hypothetical protein